MCFAKRQTTKFDPISRCWHSHSLKRSAVGSHHDLLLREGVNLWINKMPQASICRAQNFSLSPCQTNTKPKAFDSDTPAADQPVMPLELAPALSAAVCDQRTERVAGTQPTSGTRTDQVIPR